MYAIIAESGATEFLLTARETEFECEEIARNMNWEYRDEKDFVWDLYIIPYDEFCKNHAE